MNKIVPIDASRVVFDVHRDLSVTTREQRPGPPVRIDGMSIGFVTMEHDAPHGGEVHPDGDEILYVISGRIRVIGDSQSEAIELGAGEACVVPKGEWHRVNVLEKAQLMHMTPGPRGDHRPLPSSSDV